jgi:hypothetical protein
MACLARIAAAGIVWAIVAGGVAVSAPPLPPLAQVEAEFFDRLGALARRAEASGHADLAAFIRGWPLPDETDRQFVLAIPPRLETPAFVDAEGEAAVWHEFVAARRTHAEAVFAHVALVPPCAAVRLLHRVLRDDPEHVRAREAAGWVKTKAGWVWPEAKRHSDRGDDYDSQFGWLPSGRLARYRAGERYDRGRWITAAADEARTLAVADGRRFMSDHWELTSTAALAAAADVAVTLEETHTIWRQVFGPLATPPRDRRQAGRPPRASLEPLVAVLWADRRMYLAELEPLEPAIGMTQGIYQAPTRTLWLVQTTDVLAAAHATIRHEASHQLCAESRPTSPLAGETCGFWAIEAVACYLESAEPAAWGWTVGGGDAGRMPAARRLLVEEGFHVPLAELTALGRAAFQSDPRIASIYAELGGLADFFMNGDRGRYREAFIAYVARIYDGTADPDTLARLCETSYADLDTAYRRHVSR